MRWAGDEPMIPFRPFVAGATPFEGGRAGFS